MKIKSITINGYRSISDSGLSLGNTQKINLLIGANNSGKSNILKFINMLGDPRFAGSIRTVGYKDPVQLAYPLAIEDFKDFDPDKSFRFTLEVEPTEDFKLACKDIIPYQDFSITFEIKKNGASAVISHLTNFVENISEGELRRYEEKKGIHGGSRSDRLVSAVAGLNLPKQASLISVEYLDEFRKITDNVEIRKKLNDIINYNHTTQHTAKKAKSSLCRYFKDIFGFDIDIKIPSLDQEIQLVIDDSQTPLSSLGTGYQEIVLIAFVLITTSADIICIDEPELHLHPKAQRALLNLMSNIDKQFFLATHSNYFLDFEMEDKKVYRIVNENDGTVAIEANTSTRILNIIDDLGIRPSEIYQTNGIVWVEGASDRVYIKRWLELLYPDLKEGLQYTFQYYGGKVLSHYSISDEEFSNYLNLLVVNKNCFIVMDSDLTTEWRVTDLRDTKQRIIRECENANIAYWVTAGKEIENYLSERVLSIISGKKIRRNIYKPVKSYCAIYDSNRKVQFARAAREYIAVEDIDDNEDLRQKIDLIANQIICWNR